MTSISSRHVPAARALRLINAFVRDFREAPHPIHEVDAHVLSGQILNLAGACCHEDLPVSLAGQAAMSRKLDGNCWIMVCRDSVSGRRPVATAHINAQMNISDRGIHLILTIAGITRIGVNQPLPYRLERVLLRGITDSFWSPLDRAAEQEGTTTHSQTKCA